MNSRILHYEFVTGESVNITVSAENAEVIYDSRRMEHASNERSRYHAAFFWIPRITREQIWFPRKPQMI